MDLYKHERSKYDVPIDHLDYRYVEQCNDVKELEKILKILRSGTEGIFPDLEAATEEKIRQLNPKSRVLLKDQPIFSTKELGKEGSELSTDFEKWASDIHHVDGSIKTGSGAIDLLPPVRGSANISLGQQGTNTETAEKIKKKPMPRSHKEWDKVDIDAELRKLDEDESNPPAENVKNVLRKPTCPSISNRIDATGLTDDEKRYKAEKEKEKGNEAFRAKDYEEALLYYTRSISLVASIASINNRAQTYVKLEKWDEAISDCDGVLHQEPDNLKAHLRRSVAYKNKKLYREAKKDLDLILEKEPNNKRAKDLLAEVEDALAEQKQKGRRMVIQEVSDDNESDDETCSENTDKNDAKCAENVESCENSAVPHGDTSERSDKHEKVLEIKVDQSGDVKTEKQETTEAKTDATESKERVEVAVKSEETVVRPPSPPPPLSPELTQLKEEGNQQFRTGYYAEAIDKYNNIIDKIESDEKQAQNLSVLYSNRAACRHKIGDCSGCIEDCNRALVLTPQALKPLMRRAMAYEAIEKYRAAYVDYRHILAIDSTVDIALKGSTRCQQTLVQQDGPKWREKLPPIPTVSRSSLPPTPVQAPRPTQQPRTEPKLEHKISDEALFDKCKTEGNEHVKKGNFEKALECYSKCVELCPDKTAAYTNRALCYLRLNKPEGVVTDCDTALQQEPGNVKALFRRGQAYKMLCQYEASERDLELVLSLENTNSAARRELIVVQNYIAEEKAKRRKDEALAAKGRRKMHIQEADSSDDENDDDANKSDHDVIRNDVDSQEVPSAPPTANQPQPTVESKPKTKNIELSSESVESVPVEGSKSPVKGQGSGSGTQGLGVTYDMNARKPSSKLKQTAEASKGDVKATPYEFISAWTALKNTDDVEPYYEILRQVEPAQLPKVISYKLEGDMLQKIIQCVRKMADSGDLKRSFEYMKYLTKVPRFQMNTMFMSQDEKQDIHNVLKKFSKEIPDKEINALRKQYGV